MIRRSKQGILRTGIPSVKYTDDRETRHTGVIISIYLDVGYILDQVCLQEFNIGQSDCLNVFSRVVRITDYWRF